MINILITSFSQSVLYVMDPRFPINVSPKRNNEKKLGPQLTAQTSNPVSKLVINLIPGTCGKCGPNLDTQFCVEVFVEFYVYTTTPHHFQFFFSLAFQCMLKPFCNSA